MKVPVPLSARDVEATVAEPRVRRSFRWLGVLLGLGLLFGGCALHRRAEKRAVLAAHAAVAGFIRAGDFASAFRLTTEEYQQSHTLEHFEKEFSRLGGPAEATGGPSVTWLLFSSAEVYLSEEPGFFELLNGVVIEYAKEQGQWKPTGEWNLYLD